MTTKVKLIADGAITPDQITLTTASAGTNTTAPATTAFVQQEITALVDSSPAALNTLNELAAALGDDANFSTTVTNSIALKAPLASPTFTGTVEIPNLTISSAQGSDGQVLTSTGSGIAWEDAAGGGVDGIVSSADATAITIDSGENVEFANNIRFTNDKFIYSYNGGTSGQVRAGLKYDGTNQEVSAYTNQLERMRISSAGDVQLMGGNQMTNALAWYNTSTYELASIENVSHTSYNDSGGLLFKTAGLSNSGMAERMRIDSSGNVGINETSPDFSGFGSNGGGLELDDVGSSFTAVKVSQGSTGNLYLATTTGAGYLWQHSNSPLIIGTNNAERIRIQDGTGRMGINSPGVAYASAEKLSLQNDNFGFGIKTTSTCAGLWHTGSSGTFISFAYGGSGAGAGSITFSGASVTYSSNSDYRLKENVDYTWDATTRLKQLKPARFNWISDDTNTLVDGFIAHEVSSIVPEAVIGNKDQVYTAAEAENAPNTVEGDIKAQQIDASKLVPLLVKTIQELEARIQTLEG